MILLGEHTAGRANNTQLLRLLAASAVFVFHCCALTGHWTDEPVWRLTGDTNLGTIGVKCFFVLSGFLVTQSWLRRPHLAAFVSARVLRIYPALFAAVALTVLLAGMASTLPWGAFLRDPVTLDYAINNALAWQVRFVLPGAFAQNPYPDGVNGSLWTLPIEMRLYVAVAIAGVCGVLARRDLAAVALAVATAVFVARFDWLPFPNVDALVVELVALFALGSLACVWRDRLPLSIVAVAACIAAYLWNPGGFTRGHAFVPFFAYTVLVLAYHPRVQAPRFNRGGDYSYGLYLYAFPIQQTIVFHTPGITTFGLFVPAFAVTLAVAATSWHLLEKPLLGLKSRFRRLDTRDP